MIDWTVDLHGIGCRNVLFNTFTGVRNMPVEISRSVLFNTFTGVRNVPFLSHNPVYSKLEPLTSFHPF